jgi:hypothetical protein
MIMITMIMTTLMSLTTTLMTLQRMPTPATRILTATRMRSAPMG